MTLMFGKLRLPPRRFFFLSPPNEWQQCSCGSLSHTKHFHGTWVPSAFCPPCSVEPMKVRINTKTWRGWGGPQSQGEVKKPSSRRLVDEEATRRFSSDVSRRDRVSPLPPPNRAFCLKVPPLISLQFETSPFGHANLR